MRRLDGTTTRFLYWRPREVVESFSTAFHPDAVDSFDEWIPIDTYRFHAQPAWGPMRVYERRLAHAVLQDAPSYFGGNVEDGVRQLDPSRLSDPPRFDPVVSTAVWWYSARTLTVAHASGAVLESVTLLALPTPKTNLVDISALTILGRDLKDRGETPVLAEFQPTNLAQLMSFHFMYVIRRHMRATADAYRAQFRL